MTYSEDEKSRAAAWKRSTPTLPAAAKVPAPYIGKDGTAGPRPYEFCLPSEFAPLSLLPEVRTTAPALFTELGIPWHAGVDGGPSNHLLSSQVQCVNALGQMVTDPSRIVRAFGDLLGIDEVLPIEPGRYLTFEYIGPTDFFGEAPNRQRIRGAHCTSVDAAFLHRTHDDLVELVLLEWKYTESYRVRKPDPGKDAVRLGRYGVAFADPDGPVHSDELAFEFVLDEPFYQLVRQQLVAHALETSGSEGAARVRVVHVLPEHNVEYQHSLARPEHRALGDTVSEVWQRLLRRPDRFLSVDSKLFLDPEITSEEYARRYGAQPSPTRTVRTPRLKPDANPPHHRPTWPRGQPRLNRPHRGRTREHARMNQPVARRLTPARKQRLRDARINFVMSRSVDPFALEGMPGEQSCYVTVTEQDAARQFAWLAVHRVPLGGGDDLALQTDAGDTIPGRPVSAVVDWDTLRPDVSALLPEHAWGDSFLVIEPIDLDVEWQGLGVGELLVGTALAELQNSDVLAVVEPVPWFLKGRARTASAALQRPIFETLGFRSFQNGAWLLTDWALLHQALERSKQRFDFELPMNDRDD